MKELIDFINDNKCPCCGKKLSFYMKALYSDLFRVCDDEMISDSDVLIFSPEQSNTGSAYITVSNSSFNLSKSLYDKNKNAEMFLFGVCNKDALEMKSDINPSDFEINLHDVCYYKSTKFLVFNETENGLFFKINENDIKILDDDILAFEAFSFIDETKDEHKAYMMQIEHVLGTTSLWYYTCTIEDTKNEDYDPNIFHKEINAVKKNIDFSNKEKVMKMFCNWILMS